MRKSKLKQIIREEVQAMITEDYGDGLSPQDKKVDLSGLSNSQLKLLKDLYRDDVKIGRPSFIGPIEDQSHAAIVDWLFRKPPQVGRSVKQDVMELAVDVYLNF